MTGQWLAGGYGFDWGSLWICCSRAMEGPLVVAWFGDEGEASALPLRRIQPILCSLAGVNEVVVHSGC